MSVPILIGRYRIGRRLGAGGFAVVWLAHDESLDTTIAIKVMAENWVGQSDLRDRFLAEARMLRRAASSRVVQVFDIGELPDGRPYFVMEYADLGTLSDRIATTRLSLVEALRLTAEVARGAAELHRLDIVHRDLKPSNVLIKSTPDGQERLLIADLGIAKNLGQGPALTQSVGSTGYMAPEQSMPDSRVDARADVYSLGALGFQLITGSQPGAWGPVLPAEGADPGLPEPVRQLLIRTLAWEPGRRWPDATSLADRLEELANEYRAETGQPPDGSNQVEVVPEPELDQERELDQDPEPNQGTGLNPGLGSDRPAARRTSESGRRSAKGRRSKGGLRSGSAAHSLGRRGFPGRERGRRAALIVGLVIMALVWVEFRVIGQHPAAEAQSGNRAADQTAIDGYSGSGNIPPAPVDAPDLVDGDHFGLLLGSAKGQITVILIDPLLGKEALTKCRKDLGRLIPPTAVCGNYYFPRIESFVRTLKVDKKATIRYVASDDENGALDRALTGASVARLSALSKQYQQGRMFFLRTEQGVLQVARQDALGCKDIDDITPNGKSEWTAKCVERFRSG